MIITVFARGVGEAARPFGPSGSAAPSTSCHPRESAGGAPRTASPGGAAGAGVPWGCVPVPALTSAVSIRRAGMPVTNARPRGGASRWWYARSLSAPQSAGRTTHPIESSAVVLLRRAGTAEATPDSRPGVGSSLWHVRLADPRVGRATPLKLPAGAREGRTPAGPKLHRIAAHPPP